jgi:hypothetical protein
MVIMTVVQGEYDVWHTQYAIKYPKTLTHEKKEILIQKLQAYVTVKKKRIVRALNLEPENFDERADETLQSPESNLENSFDR